MRRETPWIWPISRKPPTRRSSPEHLEQYKQSLEGSRGQVVKGRILRVTDKEVFVDVNFKSEALSPLPNSKMSHRTRKGTKLTSSWNRWKTAKASSFCPSRALISCACGTAYTRRSRSRKPLKAASCAGSRAASLWTCSAWTRSPGFADRPPPDFPTWIHLSQDIQIPGHQVNKARRTSWYRAA